MKTSEYYGFCESVFRGYIYVNERYPPGVHWLICEDAIPIPFHRKLPLNLKLSKCLSMLSVKK